MRHSAVFLTVLFFLPAFLPAQNVGIGTTNPLSNLHLGGFNPAVRLDNDGSIFLYNSGSTSYTQLSNHGAYTVVQNNHAIGSLLLRPGSAGARDVLINGNGMFIGPRGPIGSISHNLPLEINASGEVFRIIGATPYITMMDGGLTRGYIQAWTDGLALASNGFDVGLWTNGVKRLAVKPNGALEVAGSAGAAGQVLTSNGAGAAPVWASPANGLYNSFRFISLSGNTFTSTSDGVWRDVPGMTYTFTIASNHYVDLSAIFTGYPQGCFGCDQPRVLFRLIINGNTFTGIAGRGAGGLYFTSHTINTGFTMPPGTHTLKFQVLSTSGSDFILTTTDSGIGNATYLKVWMVPQ